MQRLAFLVALALVGCVQPRPPAQTQADSSEAGPLAPSYPSWEEVPAAPAIPATTSPQSAWTPISDFIGQPLVSDASILEYKVRHQDRSFDLQLIAFDSHQCELKVIDQPDDWAGGGKITECLRGASAVAGVNGGFFTPGFAPMGLMISNGHRTGAWQSNPLLTGAVVVTSHLQLLWNAEVNPKEAHQLVQAGPRLVDAGQVVAGLDHKKRSTRTFIATDGGHQWILGRAHDITLSELAELLSTPGLMPAFTVHRALNLDGGRSSAIYFRTADGREHSDPGWSTVRNYLGIVPR
jgi:hypothetical protein